MEGKTSSGLGGVAPLTKLATDAVRKAKAQKVKSIKIKVKFKGSK